MWVLLTITIVAGGAAPSQFKTVNYPTYELCMQAQAQAQRKSATFGYCTYEGVKNEPQRT